jgi:D-alanyl-D-alanine carboxypeptidase
MSNHLLRLGGLIGLALSLASAPVAVMQDTSLNLLWGQATAQPEDFAIGCERLDAGQGSILFNADAAFPIASISKVLIFMAYAGRLEAGSIPLDETVAANTLDRYNLPRTDRGAHDLFMEQYPADTQMLPLWDVAVGMVKYSSNAASDYLLDRLAPLDWGSLFQTLSITGSTLPHSLTMIPLLMNNHETGKAEQADLTALSISQGESYLDLYTTDPAWREQEIAYRAPRGSDFPDWATQAAILQRYTALGTIRDYMRVLRAIYSTESPLSETVRAMTRRAMRWTDNDYINANYTEYGSKLGFYSGGTLTLIAYGHPVDGEAVISATFFRNIPRRTYSTLIRNDAIGDFAHWLNFSQCEGLQAQLP